MDEKDLSCPICLATYCEKEYIPRVLNCGHTHCTKCLIRILGNNKRCGECRAIIKHRELDENPINYAVLRMLDSQKPMTKVTQDFAEFKKLDLQIQGIVQDLNSKKNDYKETIDRLNQKINKIDNKKKDLEESKSLLNSKNREIRESQSLSEIHCLLESTLKLAHKTDLKIKELDSINFDVLEEKVLPFFELPKDFVIDFGSGVWSEFMRGVNNAKLYISQVKHGVPIPARTTAIPISDFRSHYCGALLVLQAGPSVFSVEIEIFRSPSGHLNARGSQFLAFCTGEYGPCLARTKLFNFIRKGREGECVQGGDYDHNNGKGGKAFVKGLEKGKVTNKPIVTGLLVGVQKDRKSPSSMFEIYLEGWPNKKTSLSFGKITQGKFLLQKALRLQSTITVRESYVCVDFVKKLKPFTKEETLPRT